MALNGLARAKKANGLGRWRGGPTGAICSVHRPGSKQDPGELEEETCESRCLSEHGSRGGQGKAEAREGQAVSGTWKGSCHWGSLSCSPSITVGLTIG